MKNLSRRHQILIAFVLAVSLATAIFSATRSPKPLEWPHVVIANAEEIALSEAWSLITEAGTARRSAIVSDFIYIELEEPAAAGEAGEVTGAVVKAQLPYPAAGTVTRMAEEATVELRIFTNQHLGATWTDRLLQIIPGLLIVALLLFLVLRGATKGLGLNSAFEVIEKDKLRETFADVAGIDAARAEIQEIVDFLKDPKEASRLGGRMPKGALFDGPPGAGKTLLARAMAKEAGVPFLAIEASGVNQLFVGAGAMKIKRAFREARKHAPCIVFIDEIDAMGRARGSSQSGAGDEKETTLNALLVELDGFDAREGIVVIAATNRPEILDPALTRRGRIDRKITIGLPDIEGRKAILQVHCGKIRAEDDLDVTSIASTTFGFSGADLAALVNEAALLATRAKREVVTLADFAAARDRMLVGLSGSQRKLSPAERRLTAVHEAGHALIAALDPEADPIEKATILPQGRAAGFVMQSPNQDRLFETRARLRARIRVAVAGRVAEEIVFGEDSITTGAASDIEQATNVARQMVMAYGMSDLGFIRFDPQDAALHDGDNPPVREIRRIIEAALEHVAKEIVARRDTLLALADELEARETLSGHDILTIIGPRPAAIAAMAAAE